jgi:hypothetical protein
VNYTLPTSRKQNVKGYRSYITRSTRHSHTNSESK